MKLINIDTVRRIIDSPRNKTQMLNMLEQTPTVEIIKCKDCKHWDMVDLHFHKNICSKLMRPCDESSFCSWAERRQDG